MNTDTNLHTTTSMDDDRVDHYESLVDDQATGPINKIQRPRDIVTRVHGIMLDIDP